MVEEWEVDGDAGLFRTAATSARAEAYKNVVQPDLLQGSLSKDPSGLFKLSSLDGKVRRAIDIHEDDKIDQANREDLIEQPCALNLTSKRDCRRVGQIRIADTGLILAARRAGSQLAASTAVRRTAAVVTSVSGS